MENHILLNHHIFLLHMSCLIYLFPWKKVHQNRVILVLSGWIYYVYPLVHLAETCFVHIVFKFRNIRFLVVLSTISIKEYYLFYQNLSKFGTLAAKPK